LANDSTVTGELVKSNVGEVFVDLGYDIIKIPKTSILQMVDNSVQQSNDKTVFHNELFVNSVGKRKESPLNVLVDELGEAVVLIRTPIGLGSGFLIHPDGYIVTNDHVVAGERQISVTQFKGSQTELVKRNYDNVKIVATGGNLDLALLKIEGQEEGFKFPFVTLGDSPDLKQGQRVFAIGSPLGLERSVSEGIVSLRNRIISDRLHIQTTAEISPGNSGGPLFNYKGEVVGVNNMKVVAQGAEGLGFSIPVDSLKTFLINRDAYAFDPRNPNAGFRYTIPPIQSN
jgi:serine protease Do